MGSVSDAASGVAEAGKIDRIELLESALDGLQEGIALLNSSKDVVFWNRAAGTITGYQSMELMEQTIPSGLAPLTFAHSADGKNPIGQKTGKEVETQHRFLVKLRHKLGYPVEVICRVQILRNGSEEPIGMAVVFHPADALGDLPRESAGGNQGIANAQAAIEARLQAEFQDFEEGGPSFGVLCLTVDQAEGLSRTHGQAACEALFDKLEDALRPGLRGSESMGRRSIDEFLIILHEPSLQRLTAHARLLAGLARTVDFKWWGDRISITVSIGVAQAHHGGINQMVEMLARARQGMESSLRAGGNSVTRIAEGKSCLPS